MRTHPRRRPSTGQWIWYAFGGGLPADLAEWVLHDCTTRTWVWRHLSRALVQLLPLVVLCLVVVPLSIGYRVSLAVGATLLALLFSSAYMTETVEHRVVKAGYPSGTAAELRAERAEQHRTERRSPYRQDGAGSFD